MLSMNAREDVFTFGPLSHIIAREYTQMNSIKQRRKVRANNRKKFSRKTFAFFSRQNGENRVAFLLIDRHMDLGTPTAHQQDTLLAQMINILPNKRIQNSLNCHQRTVDIQINSQPLIKTSS